MSAGFLREAVREMESPEGTGPELGQLRAWKALLSMWQAGEHRQAAEVLILCIMRSSPGADEAKIRKGLRFNGDGTLQHWFLECGLTALPEEFGTVRTTGSLDLNGNQLASLPESFGALTVGGHLVLEMSGWDIGPAHAEASRLHYPNVRGEVRM
eukprot:TRINITY_DN7551_c0_g1_i2.p4 TRINITY_DN7551_c0_g1~~TRINITY_DN7551_c0_g1_i2.p4  ORF type:complete len:155 (-),score=34.08 TRINITY_DN7551_c0_g1_i2:49-513(-)